MTRGGGDGGPRQAGTSLRAEYAQARREWSTARRRAVWLSALWWGPGAVLLGLLAGVITHFALFGLLVTVLALVIAVNVGFQRPGSLDRIAARAAAESSTAHQLRQLQVRGGAHSLHDRFYPGAAGGGPFDVEHLVIGPRGVFLLDSKQWERFDVRMFGTQLYVNHVDQYPALQAFAARAKALGEALTAAADPIPGVSVVTVTPVLPVHKREFEGTPRVIADVIIVRPEQLHDVLRAPDLRWPPEVTAQVVSVAEVLLPPR